MQVDYEFRMEVNYFVGSGERECCAVVTCAMWLASSGQGNVSVMQGRWANLRFSRRVRLLLVGGAADISTDRMWNSVNIGA
jgi:hypothetical protein